MQLKKNVRLRWAFVHEPTVGPPYTPNPSSAPASHMTPPQLINEAQGISSHSETGSKVIPLRKSQTWILTTQTHTDLFQTSHTCPKSLSVLPLVASNLTFQLTIYFRPSNPHTVLSIQRKTPFCQFITILFVPRTAVRCPRLCYWISVQRLIPLTNFISSV